MSVLYLLTSREPALAGTDAVFQDVAHLAARFGGEIVNLHPGRQFARFPRALFGFEKLARLRAAERRHDLTHVHAAGVYDFPVLRWLRNPMVYTVAAGIATDVDFKHVARLKERAHVVVSNERDAERLRERGLIPAAIINPGIEASRFHHSVLPLDEAFTLVMASAPWNTGQFETKGVDALLDAAVQLTDLRLILLWRGRHCDALLERVRARRIGDRVEVVNRQVAVAGYLARSHAAAVLAKRADVVKAYPHSLLEALAAGKPILVSEAVPMADFVRGTQCGVVVPEVACEQVVVAIQRLRSQYAALARNVMALPPATFSLETMLEGHRRLYDSLRKPRTGSADSR
jgi:glycosyltransferase involved in cell wall biosynthesis